jgi:hypothetical protein
MRTSAGLNQLAPRTLQSGPGSPGHSDISFPHSTKDLGDVGYVEHRNVAWDTAGPKVKWIDCRARKRAGARSGFAAQIFRDLIGRPAVSQEVLEVPALIVGIGRDGAC